MLLEIICQVFCKQHALKGQKLLAQGSTLGIMAISKACDENLRKLRSKCFGVPYAVFYSVMWVNCPIISMLVVLEMSKNFRYPCVVFHDIWVVI